MSSTLFPYRRSSDLDSSCCCEAPATKKLHATVKVVVRTRELAGEVRERVVAGDEGSRHGERIARQGDRAGIRGAGKTVPGQPDRVAHARVHVAVRVAEEIGRGARLRGAHVARPAELAA